MRQLCTIFLLALTFSVNSSEVADDDPNEGVGPKVFGHHTDFFIPKMFHKMVDDVTSKSCKRQLTRYREHADNFTLWAMQMLDATAKMPSGILGGSIYNLGHFDECLGVDSGESGVDRITGKYCLATVEVTPRIKPEGRCSETNPGMCSAWDKLEVPSNRMKLRRNRVYTALCVPAACTSQDLQRGLRFLKTEFQSASFDVTVNENMCHTGHEETGPWLSLFWCIVLLYGAFLLVINNLEVGTKKDGRASSVFHRVFDVRSHWGRLSSTEAQEDSFDSIDCIHGGRVFFMMLIVFGHRGEEISAGPLFNGDTVEAMSEDFFSTMVLNGHFIVDVFFTISGYLVAWNLLRNLDRGVKIHVPFLYFLRFLRLTPTYLLVVAFEALVLVDLSTGPLWNHTVGNEVDNCQRYWWTNLLYVNNFVHPERPCVGPSWYLACDMQLFLVATLIVVGLHKRKPRQVVVGLSAAIALSVVIPFVITYVGDLDATFIPDPSSLGNSAVDATYVSVYVASYCRAGPYVVGMAFAYWLNHLTSRKAKIPKGILWCGWALGPVVQFLLVASASLFYQPDNQLGRVAAALYAALHRPVFAVGVAFYITAGANGQGGFLNRWTSWSKLRPLSRLTYALFLCHTVIQMYHAGSLRTQLFMSFSDILWLALGDLVISVVLATLLYLTVERPVMVLATAIFEMTSGAAEVREIYQKEKIRRDETGKASSLAPADAHANLSEWDIKKKG